MLKEVLSLTCAGRSVASGMDTSFIWVRTRSGVVVGLDVRSTLHHAVYLEHIACVLG